MIRKLLYYFIKKSSERAHRAYYRNYYKDYLTRFESSPDKKPASVMRREMRALRKYWDCEPIHYYRYGFWRKGCTTTLDQMRSYLPDFFAYYLFFPVSFRDRNVLCEDKRLMYSMNVGLGIAQPELLFSTQHGEIFGPERLPISAAEALRRARESGVARIFFKPNYGVGGKGIRAFERLEGGNYVDGKSGEPLTESLLTEFAKDDYIVQHGLIQHPVLNEIYPHAINTFRIVTECDAVTGEVRIPIVMFRMGCGGGVIDNASSGGMYMRIDPQTGILSDTALKDDRTEFSEHPDTGFRFSGYKIPVWEELICFSREIALKYREIRYIGWDIAYTVDGPSVIEGNNGPGIEIIQDYYGGLRDVLHIDDPRKYWFREDYSLKNL